MKLRVPPFHRRRLALALAGCAWLNLAPAATPSLPSLPTGLQLVQGQATAAVNGNKLTVTNSNGAILNWQSFSIGAQNAVRFEQPNAASKVLNRVTGNDPSNILGSLSSNGQVWLLNPNGVLFGQGARVDVAGLVVSTLNLNDSDWTAGRYVFAGPVSGPNGAVAGIANQGEIRAASGGQVMLLSAGEVRNEGVIEASGGQIVLAAGASVELLDTASPRLSVKVSAPAGEVLNLGQVNAAGGRIDVLAASVNQQGVVKADALSVGPGGEIVIRADQRLTLGAGSKTSADAANGQGGSIQLLGTQVALQDGSAVSASGASGGGTVLVGGGLQGRDASVPNADAVYFAPGASIHADATQAGDGGLIVLWSDTATRAFGTLSATGGPQRGDGGFIETSGGWLDARPARVNLSAAHGAAGRWLLDPHDLYIGDFYSDTVNTSGDTTALSYTPGGDDSTLSTATINAALNAGTNVTITTAGSGTQAGRITLGDGGSNTATILTTAGAPGSLTLLADGDILMQNSSITSNNGPLALTMRAGANGASGGVTITGSSISTNGGNIILGGAASGALAQGGTFTGAASGGIAIVNDSTIDAGTLAGAAGTVELYGVNAISLPGVSIHGSQVLGRTITIYGASDGGRGVELQDASLTSRSTTTISGVGGNLSGNAEGVAIVGDSQLSGGYGTGASGIGLDISGRGTGGSTGLYIASSLPVEALNSASVSLYGEVPTSADKAVLISGSSIAAGFTLTLTAAGSDAVVEIDASSLSAQQPLTLSGAGTLAISDSSLHSGHLVTIQADRVTISGSDAGISSSAPSGDSILIEGKDGASGVISFINTTGASALDGGGARWIVWAQDITDSQNFNAGGLAYDFTHHGVSGPADWASDAGSGGFVSSAAQSAQLSGYVSKAYNGDVVVSNTSGLGFGSNVPMNGQGSLNAGASIEYSSKDVGYGALHAVDPTAATFVDGNGKPMYGVTIADGGTGEITRAPLTISLAASNKVYDGLDTAVLGVASVTGLAPGEQLTITASGTFADKNVGTAKHVEGNASLADGSGGGLASNYFLAGISNASGLAADITPLALTVTGLSALNKTYDRTTTASLIGTAQITPVSGDDVALAGTAAGSFADRNVGTAKPVSIGGLFLSGDDAGNYTLTAPTASANITPLNLSVSGLGTANKVYDATTAATLTGTAAVTPLAGDSVVVQAGYSGSFLDKNVSTGKPVVVNGLVLGGADAGNYTVSAPTGLFADITPATLLVTGLSAQNKVYDATRTATLAGTAAVSGFAGDAVSLSGTASGQFADKNVGTAKAVTLGGLTLSGADAGNYTLQLPTGLTADITPLNLSVSGLSALDKVYDRTTAATLSGTATAAGLAGDDLTLVGTASGAFSDRNAGSGKAVGISGLSLAGSDAGNYTLSTPSVSASITPLNLSVTGLSAVDKVYDATTAATLAGTATVTPLAGDSVVVQAGYSGSFVNKDVGTAKGVSVGGLVLGGSDAGNYTVSPPSNLSADITPATLVVTGLNAQNKVYDATRNAVLSGTAGISAFAGDAVSLSGTASGQFADKNVGTAKAVTVGGLALAGADAGNYTLQMPASLVADITPATLVLTGLNAQDKVYDATRTATLVGTAGISAFAGDAVTLSGTASGQFADKNVGTAKAVSIGGLTLAGSDAGNYTLQMPTGLSADITPATLSYVATAVSKPLNQAMPALSGSVIGFVGGETLADATSGTLSFTTTATADSPRGSYAVEGQGLSAANYRFVQGAGNATALTVSAPTTAAPPPLIEQSTAVAIQASTPTSTSTAQSATTPSLDGSSTRASGSSGVLDLTAPPVSSTTATSTAIASSTAVSSAAFAPVHLSGLSMDALAALLARRDAYKQRLFADAVYQLQQNPSLADAHVCQSLAEAAAGTCLVTEELKRQAQAQPELVAAVAPPVAPPGPTPAAPAAAEPPRPAAAVPSPLPSRRHVRLAALPQIERKVAVVIGVDRYADGTIPPLANAVNDAQAVGALFGGELGYETVVIPNASKAAVIGTLNRLALAMGPRDSVVIYYAGHGELVAQGGQGEQGFWLLADADAKKPETWLSNQDIGRLITQINASQVALISDSCYSGSLVSKDERIRPSGTPPDPAQLLQRKSVVVMSSGGNEPVSDAGRQGHSPFTWNLLNQLGQVKAWQPGGNVFERVRFAVARELPQRPQYGAAAGHQSGGDYLFEQRQLEQ